MLAELIFIGWYTRNKNSDFIFVVFHHVYMVISKHLMQTYRSSNM